jgi:hypothetical protein
MTGGSQTQIKTGGKGGKYLCFMRKIEEKRLKSKKILVLKLSIQVECRNLIFKHSENGATSTNHFIN